MDLPKHWVGDTLFNSFFPMSILPAVLLVSTFWVLEDIPLPTEHCMPETMQGYFSGQQTFLHHVEALKITAI